MFSLQYFHIPFTQKCFNMFVYPGIFHGLFRKAKPKFDILPSYDIKLLIKICLPLFKIILKTITNGLLSSDLLYF